MKQRIIADSLWAAEFTLLFARDYADQGDIYNTVGCFTRVASNLTQTLFALNERYFIRDKHVLDTVANFERLPKNFIQETERILACPGDTSNALRERCDDLVEVWLKVVKLASDSYEPKFKL